MRPYIISLTALTLFFIILDAVLFTQSSTWLNKNINNLIGHRWLLRSIVTLYASYWFLGIFVTLPVINYLLFFLPQWLYHCNSDENIIFYCYKNIPMTGKGFLAVIALFFIGFISDKAVRKLHRIISSLLLKEPVDFQDPEANF